MVDNFKLINMIKNIVIVFASFDRENIKFGQGLNQLLVT